MPRCANCAKANREGSLFCQDCGHRLNGASAASGVPGAPAAPAAPQGAPAAPAAGRPRGEGVACPSCGTMNPPGMNFCKLCGTALTARPLSAAPNVSSGRVTCSQCGKHTPGGFAFCQHCGHRLQAQEEAPAAARAGRAEPAPPPAGSQQALPPMPTPPAGVRSGAPAVGAGPAPAYGAPGAPLGRGGALLGRLIAVRRDGSDGDIIPLTGETFDIGRQEGSLCFAEDPFLAPRHVRFLVYGGVVRVRPLDTVNGVFLRLRDPYELQSGDVFYIGKELLRFELTAAEERDPPSLVEHGVRLFGSAPRESWGRLRQLTVAGTTRDMWYLSRPEVILGREEGDIIFPDDEFMSRRHAMISRAGGRMRLVDQNSSNGTYLRLRGDRELRPSDVLRMGDQLLRFEP